MTLTIDGYATDVVLRDGSTIRLRPVTTSDGSALVALQHNLTPEDIRFRFQGVVRTLDEPFMERFAESDFNNVFAIVAETGNLITSRADW